MEYPQRKNTIFIMLLLVWALCSKDFFISQVRSLKNSFRFLPLSIEQKYKLMDGELYKYVQYLRTQIPESSRVIFINNSKDLKKYTPEWVKFVYDRERLSYYLYPRTFVQYPSGHYKKEDYKVVYTLTAQGAIIDLDTPGQEIDVTP